jgi:hypothetical protein
VLTALRGREIERVPVRFLGTYKDFIGPGYDIYLIELEGPVAERVGVAAGMSGSPVFFEGELVGALAYRLLGGGLPTEPVAGVTPIHHVLDAARGSRAPGTAAGAAAARSGAPTPIATPVAVGGMAPAVRDWLAEQLEPLGFVVGGGGSGAGAQASGDAGEPAGSGLVPGSPVGAQLVRGDLSIAATGTVTWVDGDAVYAFGHPFLGEGSVELPMVAADVIHTLGDLAGSVKLSNVGAEMGAIVDDRLTAIVGRSGEVARMIPLSLHVDGPSFGERSFGFELARSRLFTPLLAGAVIANALVANTAHEASATVRASGTVRLRGLPELPIEVAFAADGGPTPAIGVAATVQRTLAALWSNPYADVEIEGMSFDVAVVPEVVSYNVDAVLYDRTPLGGGETLTVRCVLSRYRGEGTTRELELTVPAGLPADSELLLIVGTPTQIDRTLGSPAVERLRTAQDLDAVVRVLAEPSSPHRLRAVLVQKAPGAVSRGVSYEALPPSAARLLGADERSSARRRTRFSRLATAEVELDGPVTGGAVLRFRTESASGEEDGK